VLRYLVRPSQQLFAVNERRSQTFYLIETFVAAITVSMGKAQLNAKNWTIDSKEKRGVPLRDRIDQLIANFISWLLR
jgi:hypothetical protein